MDPDFDYLIRLHFCELQFNKANQRIFRIYINNKTIVDNFDVYVRARGKNKGYHQDYFDAVSSKINTLWIQLGLDTAVGASRTDALLNGFDSIGNSIRNSKTLIFRVVIGASITSVLILVAACTFIFCFCRTHKKELSDTKDNAIGWRPLILHGIVSSIGNAKGEIQKTLMKV